MICQDRAAVAAAVAAAMAGAECEFLFLISLYGSEETR
jgi:hypothetical protein